MKSFDHIQAVKEKPVCGHKSIVKYKKRRQKNNAVAVNRQPSLISLQRWRSKLTIERGTEELHLQLTDSVPEKIPRTLSHMATSLNALDPKQAC